MLEGNVFTGVCLSIGGISGPISFPLVRVGISGTRSLQGDGYVQGVGYSPPSDMGHQEGGGYSAPPDTGPEGVLPPLDMDYSGIQSESGRYASYWNAVLLPLRYHVEPNHGGGPFLDEIGHITAWCPLLRNLVSTTRLIHANKDMKVAN